MAKSVVFFETNFQIQVHYSIAVLDSNDWVKIARIPYGLPFESGPPFVVCIPASSENILADTIKDAIVGRALGEKFSMTDEGIVNLFVSLIGFHELGHIYARTYGIKFPNKWTSEFGATYFAYAYLEENCPKESEIWRDVSRVLANKIKPDRTSLLDFEKLYVRVGVQNYAWYQVVFLLRVSEVYQDLGIDFLKTLKRKNRPLTSESYSVNQLEAINPGFVEWAQKYRLLD